eukprot:UN07612
MNGGAYDFLTQQNRSYTAGYVMAYHEDAFHPIKDDNSITEFTETQTYNNHNSQHHTINNNLPVASSYHFQSNPLFITTPQHDCYSGFGAGQTKINDNIVDYNNNDIDKFTLQQKQHIIHQHSHQSISPIQEQTASPPVVQQLDFGFYISYNRGGLYSADAESSSSCSSSLNESVERMNVQPRTTPEIKPITNANPQDIPFIFPVMTVK